MYIEPNTNIKIYHNVPLDNTYNHTLYFANLTRQNEYFHGNSNILKYNLTNQSYQRVVKGTMRIAVKADNLYDCNYLAFQNTSFGQKWFYAFITSVEYVNNETSEITFEIDSIQSYMFDVQIKECFVEREHSVSDLIGENIQAEPVALGEYIISDYEPVGAVRDMCVLIQITAEDGAGTLYDGIYGGCDIWAFNATDTTSISSKLNEYIQRPDQVVNVYMAPSFLFGEGGIATGGKKLLESVNSIAKYVELNSVTADSQDFGNYTSEEVQNNKLYTYPYNFLRVDNASGQSLNLRYEFFENHTPVIQITGSFLMPVKVVARPCSYKGLPGYSELEGYTASTSECITLESYPMCSWNVDSYKAWVAQNSVPIALNTIAGVTNAGIASQYSAHPSASLASSVIGQVAGIVSNYYTASIVADQCRGNISNGNVNVSRNMQGFFKNRCHITGDYARVIDNFFTMYGYATNRVKQPNISSRPHWNYIKTVGCVAQGNAPSDDIKKICSIYDNGITFWKEASEVGNYTFNNKASIR